LSKDCTLTKLLGGMVLFKMGLDLLKRIEPAKIDSSNDSHYIYSGELIRSYVIKPLGQMASWEDIRGVWI